MDRKEKYKVRTAGEAAWCADYCRQWWSSDAEHILRIAEDALRNEFLFDLPWDMEPTTEPVRFEQDIQWDYMPGEDPEFIYQFNRHRYWICLGQAYALTGDEKYVSCFVRQLTDWVRANPLCEHAKKTTWRTIEAGIRGENWCKAISYMIDSPLLTEEVLDVFEKSLLEHGAYLYGHDVPFSVKSNWGILENSGLYRIGKVLGNLDFADKALERLYQQARIQVLPDGVHWEQSPMYHNEVLHCFLEVLQTAEKYGDRLKEDFVYTVMQMAYADLAWIKPNHCQPAGGDSDETDIRDILSIAACQFKNSHFKFKGYSRLGFEAVWDYGRESAEAYAAMKEEAPWKLFFPMPESGNWFRRSDWREDADYLHFRCGSLGGGHGHMDKLHVDAAFCGEDVLIDSGRYSYVPGSERYRYKGAASHNVFMADGEEYTTCLDAWAVSKMTLPVNCFSALEGEYSCLEAGHPGYWDRGIYVNRRIISPSTRVHILVDEAYGCATHTYSQLYHFNPQGETKLKQERGEVIYTGRKTDAVLIPLTTGMEITAENCTVSDSYNRQTAAACVRVAKTAGGFCSMITVLLGAPAGQLPSYTLRKVPVTAPETGDILSDSIAEGILLEYGSKAWLVVIRHCETAPGCDYIGAEGRFGLGQVMICELHKDREFTVLKW